MSLNKWLKEDKSSKNKKKSRAAIISPFKEQKLKKIKESIIKQKQKPESKDNIDIFLSYVSEFKEFLNSRTYLRGDIEHIISWINNLNYKYKELLNLENSIDPVNKNTKIELLKDIPPTFLDEKLTLALKKYVYRDNMNNSDKYYLRKLKKIAKDELKKAKLYQILDKILTQ